MSTNTPNDAHTAAEYAAAARKSIESRNYERAAAEASLAVYHQLLAAEDGERA